MIDAEFWFTGEPQIGVDLGNRHRSEAQGADLAAVGPSGCRRGGQGNRGYAQVAKIIFAARPLR